MLALNLLGIALIALSALFPLRGRSNFAIAPLAFISAGLLIVMFQLIPLPPDIWAALPGRQSIVAGFGALGSTRPALPISEAPYLTVTTLFAAIPALAAFLAVTSLRPGPRWIAAAVVAGAVISTLLGALQVASGPGSWVYLYRITNTGAVGFFANHNHMATLLLVAIPMSAVLAGSTRSGRNSIGKYGLAAALLLLLLGGIALNGSLAAIALSIPVLLASASLLPVNVRWRRFTLPLAILALCGGVVLIAENPIGTAGTDAGALTSIESRTHIWKTTSYAIENSFPVGTGLGTFEQVYRQYEDPGQVTPAYVNHAHNDYLELALELGLPGLLLIAGFLVWWAVTTGKIWTSQLSTLPARAATVATAAILAHSIVDFPLRTAAISAIFGACLGMMNRHLGSNVEQRRGDLRPMRHVKLG